MMSFFITLASNDLSLDNNDDLGLIGFECTAAKINIAQFVDKERLVI